MYPDQLTVPIRSEVQEMGLVELRTAAEVDTVLGGPGTRLVFINSVCGCAAGGARPGLRLALERAERRPERLATVFAGVDREATAKVRGLLADFPASSPSAALLRNGQVVWMLHRHQIEGRTPDQIAGSFARAFAEHCSPG